MKLVSDQLEGVWGINRLVFVAEQKHGNWITKGETIPLVLLPLRKTIGSVNVIQIFYWRDKLFIFFLI